jgi:polyphosphate kinase
MTVINCRLNILAIPDPMEMMNKASSARRFPPEHFLNRELSLLAFNRRVLGQAADERVPLLERLRFLCIVSSNLDEFFEIRVAGLKEQIKLGAVAPGSDGLTPHEAFRRISAEAHDLIEEQYALLNDGDAAGAGQAGHPLPQAQRLERSAGGLDPRLFLPRGDAGADADRPRPGPPLPARAQQEPQLRHRAGGQGRLRPQLGRRHRAGAAGAAARDPPARGVAGAPYGFVFLSSVLHANVGELFSGMNVLGCYQFRATRNSDLWVDEEEIKNLRLALQGELPQRHFGDAVRLEVADSCSET